MWHGEPVDPRCNFCFAHKSDGRSMIAGPGIYICSQCVELAFGTLRASEQLPARRPDGGPSATRPSPRDITDDGFQPSDFQYGESLNNGRVFHEALTSIEHHRDAVTIVDTLSHVDLIHLALYVAADAAATRSEQQQNEHVWLDWWRGDLDIKPTALLRIVRPPEGNPDSPPFS